MEVKVAMLRTTLLRTAAEALQAGYVGQHHLEVSNFTVRLRASF